MHHYRPDETDVFYGSGAPTVSKSERPHIYIDFTAGVQYLNLGGIQPGASATYYPFGSQASGRIETVTADARVIVAADHGMTFFLSRAAGIAFTLPANSLTGFTCTFIVKTAPTTDCTITAATADTIIGYPVASSGGDESANGNAAGDVLNFKANTALPSDSAVFVSDGTSWHVRAIVKATGAVTITG